MVADGSGAMVMQVGCRPSRFAVRLCSVFFLILLAVAAWASPLWAQQSGDGTAATQRDQRETARQAYDAGKRAVEAGQFAQAYEQFKKAHSIIPTPHTQYWIAFCLDTQGKTKEALAAYDEFLANPKRGQAGQDKVKLARERQNKLKVDPETKPATADKKQAKGGREAQADTAKPSATAGAEPVGKRSAQEEPLDGATFAVRVRALEQRIDQLKEQVRRSHTRLSLLSETILSTGVGAARAAIRFRNDLTTAFRIERVLFVLDGAVQFNKRYSGSQLSEKRLIPIFTGSLPPGDHTVQVLLQLRGHGYGVFSYLEGYRLTVKSAHSFTVTEGKTVDLTVVAWEKGGVTTPLVQRPTIRYVEKLRTARSRSSSRPSSGKH
jgi:hypothetical protein